MTHAIAAELEQTLPDGVRIWTVRCTCGQEFSSKFAMGLTPRRSARAAYRRHLDQTPQSHIRVVAIEVEGPAAASIAEAALTALGDDD